MTNGDRQIAAVVKRVKSLPGVVVSPDDPFIAFWAKGYLGRNMRVEMDTLGGREVPQPLLNEIAGARWYVQVHSMWEARDKLNLSAMGFRRRDDFSFDADRYVLWEQVSPKPPPSTKIRTTRP